MKKNVNREMQETDRRLYIKYIEDYSNRPLEENLNALKKPDANWTNLGLLALNEVIQKQRARQVKEEGKNHSNDHFILDPAELPKRIDHAVGCITLGDIECRYYGAILTERIPRDNGVQIKQVPAIVLEDGQILSKSSCPNGLRFELSSTMTLLENRWSISSIKAFCDMRSGKITFREVFLRFKKFYDRGMVFELNEWYSLNPVWDMTTYFYDLIDKFLIIKHEGKSGAAKSKAMKISANLSFNGRKWLCPTPANFFRYRHHNKSMVCIEEAEKLFDDSKGKSSQDSELVEYINGSYEKGNYVPRQNDKNINQTDEFDPAGFTRIGSIKPLKGALLKRSITLSMLKASKTDERSMYEPSSANDPEYQEARNMMYICGLQNYREYQDKLSHTTNEYGLGNREWALAKPLVAMAGCIEPGLEKSLGRFIARLFEVRDASIEATSWEKTIALLLLEKTAISKDGVFVSNDELKASFLNRLESSGEGQPRLSTNSLTALMKSMSLGDYYGRNSKRTERGYNLSFFRLLGTMIRSEILEIEEILKKVSELSVCLFTVEEIAKWYTDSFQTNLKKGLDLSDFSDNRTDRHFFGGVPASNQEPQKSLKIRSKQDILQFIRENDTGPGVSVEDILSSSESKLLIEKQLEELAFEGELMTHKPGRYKVLE